MGADGDANLDAGLPQAAFDPVRQRYARRLARRAHGRAHSRSTAASSTRYGDPLAGGAFRISTMGANEVDAFNALSRTSPSTP